jgi:hypothetical protein
MEGAIHQVDAFADRPIMRTRRLGRFDVRAAALAEDLAAAARFRYSDTDREFVCGQWLSCWLWNRSGDIAETHLSDDPGQARQTEYGRATPYLTELLETLFVVDRLRRVRLARLTPGSVLVPHRDHLEPARDLTRIHLPLRTDQNCLSAEEDTVYRMREGEIWFLDATRTHAAASFSTSDRVHLIADFAGDLDSVVRFPIYAHEGIPAVSVCARPPAGPDAAAAVASLAGVLTAATRRDVLAILIKRCFELAEPIDSVFRTMRELAAATGRPELVDLVRAQELRCLPDRRGGHG